MTQAEMNLQDDKARAEIANLNALTSKLVAETSKINKETRWYEAIVLAAVIGATAALTKLFF